MAIHAHPEHCARRETQLREETLVRDLLHLSLGNPRTYQQVLLALDQQVREHLPKQDGSTLFHLDDVTMEAMAAIRRAGGSVEYNEDAAMAWLVRLPKRAILCTMPLDDGREALCINNGRDHLVIGLVYPDTEYAYEGCDVIH